MRQSVLVIISAMKSICGVLYRNCTAIKSTFHRAMKCNGCNSDCKGEVTSRNTLRIGVSNPYYALLSMVSPRQGGPPYLGAADQQRREVQESVVLLSKVLNFFLRAMYA